MSNSGSSSLRPAWKGGRGFQPPPTVTSERESSRGGGGGRGGGNKFSALSDDDDFQVVSGKKQRDRSNNNNNSDHNGEPKINSRGEAFRSSFGGGGGRSSKPGRSLADLAARVPEGMTRSASTGTTPAGRRFSDAPRGGSGDPAEDAARSSRNEPSAYKQAVDAAKVIRYTREKLLALRPRPVPDGEFPPQHLKHVEATILLSETPQDPVCWDTLDADEIWATVPTRRSSAPTPKGAILRGTSEGVIDGSARRGYVAPSSGRWERGKALPPAEERERRAKEKDANNPEDLWDDPIGGSTGAAMDFSAFGGMPEGDIGVRPGGSVGSGDTFDFEKMAEATRKFEEELHGSRSSADGVDGDGDDPAAHNVKIDPKRPLASVGTTIQSGSGDDVNVFEDFDNPVEEGSDAGVVDQPATTAEPAAGIKGVDEDPTASSRLMAMIGVKKEQDILGVGGINSGGSGQSPWNGSAPADANPGLLGLGGAAAGTAIPLNPWGDPIIPGAAQPAGPQPVGLGMDLATRLESFAAEQKAREAAEMEQKALMRRRQEQEEQQRRALAQQQAQERARQQAQQQSMQQPSPQSQVELVLMERITTILENSWGRSDLMSILSTLHAEDSRVIPLLSNVDLLRDLIAHNPRRVALRQDPAFGTEMAVLQMTNAQFQQHEAQVRAQQEQLRRRQEQARMENLQRQRSMSHDGVPRINPDAPWFYSDPQGNIQGPFRGDEMRQWLEAGYFKGDLPISQQANGPFIALSAIFPDIGVAFKMQPDRSQEEAEARARAEEERMMEQRRLEERQREERMLEQQRLEQQRREEQQRLAEEQQSLAQEHARREQEAREAAERQRQQMEASKASAGAQANGSDNGGNESSAQLKMMLGLSGGQQLEQPQQAKATSVQPQTSKAETKAQNNNEKRASEPPAPAAKPAAPAWGGAAQSAPSGKKSMSEIQREEARRAAALAQQQGGLNRQSSSGWANVAAAGTSAWTPGAVRPTAAGVVAGGPAVAAGRGMGAQGAARPTGKAPAAGGGLKKTNSQQQRSSTSTAEEFGASMSPAFEKWCKEQMMKLNGSDDLTLVAFCMTLNDAAEIRQYLTTYLGSTPQVNNFATEFINKKGLGPPRQEEWETPGSAKKGRKKKGGAR